MANLSRSISTFTKLLKTSAINGNLRQFSQGQLLQQTSSKLMYSEYGDPVKVIKKLEEELPEELEPNDILVRMLAAPVNPADINTIEGKYPAKPNLPAVAGNEGVGEVVKVGNEVQEVAVGDRVVPLTSGLGTWRTHAIFPQNTIFKVPKKLGLVEAATLTVNPCTAYRMLRDFTDLKPGDTVIQNGANSACGQNVIQICRVWGIRTVNIVRNRPNIDELKNFLLKLGATIVLTEEELRTTDIFKTGKLVKPRLALNCVGGKSALEIMRQLQPESSIVTYGGMSREPVTVPTSALIFKDIKVRGFWMTRWSTNNFESEERQEMFDELISMMTNDELHGPAYKVIQFDDYREALANAMNMKGMIGRKYILGFATDMEQNN